MVRRNRRDKRAKIRHRKTSRDGPSGATFSASRITAGKPKIDRFTRLFRGGTPDENFPTEFGRVRLNCIRSVWVTVCAKTRGRRLRLLRNARARR